MTRTLAHSTILQQLGFTRLKSNVCVFAKKNSTLYIMAYVDHLLVVAGDNTTTLPFLRQFQQYLEKKHTQVNSQRQLHLSFLARQFYYKMTEQLTCHFHPNTTTRS
eukprot:4907493-Amphidinium_carterae.4